MRFFYILFLLPVIAGCSRQHAQFKHEKLETAAHFIPAKERITEPEDTISEAALPADKKTDPIETAPGKSYPSTRFVNNPGLKKITEPVQKLPERIAASRVKMGTNRSQVLFEFVLILIFAGMAIALILGGKLWTILVIIGLILLVMWMFYRIRNQIRKLNPFKRKKKKDRK
ncbi:MAG: hypothetical protein M3Q97_02535 [Bacteroidota bacterium]|nr:hypothetical protein [Bacteroidota bacterium]